MGEAPRGDDQQFLESIKKQVRAARSPRMSASTSHRSRRSTRASISKSNFPVLVLGYRSGGRAGRSLPSAGAFVEAPSSRAARFVVAGHTDAVGSYASNQELSERARRIRQALPDGRTSQIPAREALVTVGYGKDQAQDRV